MRRALQRLRGASSSDVVRFSLHEYGRVRRFPAKDERGEFEAGVYRRLGKGGKVHVSFLSGIGKSGDKLVVLLDMDRLLCDGELQGAVDVAA